MVGSRASFTIEPREGQMKKDSTSGQLDALAEQVGKHPDYRVLRRLDTSVEYPALTGPDVARGVILDTETTGLDWAADKIIELGLVVFEYERGTGAIGRVLGSYDGLEDPGMAIPPASTAVHGITDEMVTGQRLDDAAIARLMEGVAVVIAHNAGFDRKFVEGRLPRFADLPWGCSFKELPWDVAGIGSAKLEYLAYQYGFFYEGHRAEIDCRALLEILRRPLGRVWEGRGAGAEDLFSGPDWAVRDVAAGTTALKSLLDRARLPSYRVWATGSPFETKDVLKARQYRWDGDERCWWIELPAEALEAELAWLRTAVYGGRSAVVDVDVLDARVRYSTRSGKRERRGL
jgi:DNA polymerase-3 subunit epsilon